MQSKWRFQLSLRTGLILLAVVPLLLAMSYTRELRLERYDNVTGRNGTHSYESMWKRYVWSSQWRLEYMVVYLPRNTPGSARPGGLATSDVLSTPTSWGISKIPSGLFFKGRRVNTKESGRCFVYDPNKDEIRPLPCDEAALDSLTLQQLRGSESEEFWQTELNPLLQKEGGR